MKINVKFTLIVVDRVTINVKAIICYICYRLSENWVEQMYANRSI